LESRGVAGGGAALSETVVFVKALRLDALWRVPAQGNKLFGEGAFDGLNSETKKTSLLRKEDNVDNLPLKQKSLPLEFFD
jgi:hypothetical protein